MAINTDIMRDRIGLIKLLTIVVGIVLLGFIGHSYYHRVGLDEAFLSCVIICFIISFLWAVVIIADIVPQSDLLRKVDMLFHMIAFVFYVITLICFAVSLIDYRTGKKKTNYRLWQRVVAFILGAINTSLYGYAAILFYKSIE